MWHRIKRTGAVTVLSLALCGAAVADQITVFAAASLKEALDDVANGFEAQSGHQVTTSYAGTSALARQIEYGAPADIFIAANRDWMDRLAAGGQIAGDTRFDLLGNRLALIGPATDSRTVTLTPNLDLGAMLQGGRLAMALTQAVPAGIYGKAALETLGLWDVVAPHVAETDNVRAALALVALGAAPLGIVYATDAKADTRVRTLGLFPDDSHPPITYPAAATRDPNAAARQFLDHLRSPDAHAVFARYGFLTELE